MTDDFETADPTPAETVADIVADTPEEAIVPEETAAPAEAETEPAPADGAPPAAPEAASRPEGVPEKFWDPEAGALRTDALLKSYLELERKLGSMVPLPAAEDDVEGQERLRRALGVPASAEEYDIEPPSDLLAPDGELNARLHEAGFNQRQAQLVYDLAAQYVTPLIADAAAEVEATRDAERLASHFGGHETWQRLAPQIKTWAKANLPGDAVEVLASSYDGVIALHQMMQAREPRVLRDADAPTGAPDEARLASMMRDPRYWRDRDPAFVAEVTDGFKRLYGA